MKLLKKIPTKSKSWIDKFEKANHIKYIPSTTESLPYYELVDEVMKPVTTIDLQYNPDTMGYDKVKIPVVFSQANVNYFKSVGQIVEVFDAKDLKAIKDEEKVFKDALSKARAEGYEAGKKSVTKAV